MKWKQDEAFYSITFKFQLLSVIVEYDKIDSNSIDWCIPQQTIYMNKQNWDSGFILFF